MDHNRIRQFRYLQSNRDPALSTAQPSYATSNWSPSNDALFRAIWVSASGDVYTINPDGSTGVWKNVPVGLHPIGGRTIVAANDGSTPTTATIDTVVLEN